LWPSGHQLLQNSARYEQCSGSRYSPVSVATRLWAEWSRVQCWAVTTDYCLVHNVWTSSRPCQALYSMHTGGSFPEGRAVWS
jgi:hypothetical protein